MESGWSHEKTANGILALSDGAAATTLVRMTFTIASMAARTL
jgi:hypothetical protein